VFEHTATQVLEPGFELHGIDTGPMRRWIDEMRARVRQPMGDGGALAAAGNGSDAGAVSPS
jgi:hypothetical protein